MIAGVTGHQDLKDEPTREWVRARLVDLCAALPVTRGLTCLARGADQLFAEVLRAQGVPYIAVLSSRRIETSFGSPGDLALFRTLRGCAAEEAVLDFDQPSEVAYTVAGRYVVDHCDRLLAVWDGAPAKGPGGTGDVVAYALRRGRPVTHLDIVGMRVVELGRASLADE